MLLPPVPEATVIGFAKVGLAAVVFCKEASALPPVSPIVITLLSAPKALLATPPFTVPALIASPLVNVFVPDKTKDDVAEFWTTPVTLVPMTPEMVVVAVVLPLFVIVPVGFIEVPDNKVPPAVAFKSIPVTLEPIDALIVTVPVFVLALVIVPTILIGFVDREMFGS